MRIVKAGFGLFSILVLLAIILILLPEQIKQDSTATTTESDTTSEQDSETGIERQIGDDSDADQTTANRSIVKNDMAAVPERPEVPKGTISIVIDDVGYSLEELKPFLSLPGKVTFAVLPGLKHSTEAARLIKASGKDLLLHLPMESDNGNDPGPGAIYVGDDPETIAKTLEADLDSVPGAIGINNHMGSRATADIGTMSSVFSAMQGKGLFFLDSKTTPDSRASEIGQLFGIEVIERNIFLDNDTSPEAILSQVEKGLSVARESGSCIFIGHVRNRGVLDVLTDVLPSIAEKSYILMALTKITGVPES